MKKKLTLFALIIIAAGFVLALNPAIKNFEPYTTKAYAPPTTKPLTQQALTKNTQIYDEDHTIQEYYENNTPTQETCQTDQNVNLGHPAYLCRRFDDNYNIETGSLTVNSDGHEFRFELDDNPTLGHHPILVSCYVDGELQKSEQLIYEGGALNCEIDGIRTTFYYNEYIEGNKTQCHGNCDSHEDEVDDARMRGVVGGSGRLPEEETTTNQKPLQQITQTIQKIFKKFIPWLHN
jgi:hypothetical protein